LEFPAELSDKVIKGDVLIYCPSDEKKDLSRNIVTENNLMKISLPEQNKGFHQIKVKFNADGINYYFEKNLNIKLMLVPFILGLVSSLHCIGMCGPIAMMVPRNEN
jgi:hypothetical protein